MKIYCPYCKKELVDTDVVTLDIANGLAHYQCYDFNPTIVKEVGKYGTIKSKYVFLFKK